MTSDSRETLSIDAAAQSVTCGQPYYDADRCSYIQSFSSHGMRFLRYSALPPQAPDNESLAFMAQLAIGMSKINYLQAGMAVRP